MAQNAREPGDVGAGPSRERSSVHTDGDPSTLSTDNRPSPSTALDWALTYADGMGWHIFPAPRGEKKSHKSAEHSNGRRWGATADPDEIKRDFRRWPLANLGIPTGRTNRIFDVETDKPAPYLSARCNLLGLQIRVTRYNSPISMEACSDET